LAQLSAPERQKKRDKVARGELEKLFTLFEETQKRLLPRHNLQEHLSYALNQREATFRYLEDGRYHIDNNSIERLIRPIAIGRKKLFIRRLSRGCSSRCCFLFPACHLQVKQGQPKCLALACA
jgi:hypothetical protein